MPTYKLKEQETTLILSISKSEFVCPYCNHTNNDSDCEISERIEKSKDCNTLAKCQSCNKKLIIFVDFMGNMIAEKYTKTK